MARSSHHACVTAQLNISLDSTGAVPRFGLIGVLAIDDTSALPDVMRMRGLRFRRTATNQLIDRVRCTLTIPRTP